jgi:uncharacterized membrane protein
VDLLLIFGLTVLLVILARQHERLRTLEQTLASLRTPGPELERAGQVDEASATDAASLPEGIADPQKPRPAFPAPAAPGKKIAGGRKVEPTRQPVAKKPVVGTKPVAEQPDIETALGTRWAVWIGGLALALGGIFLVRYSLEAGIFGPRVRLAAATVFGLALAAAGEFARRRGFRSPVAGIRDAYIPSILTAASAFTLFGSVYAAHALYGLLGPGLSFVLLGGLAIATVLIALVHGQALAGLGLIGSYVTPVLVSSDAPNPWVLFIYLAIALCAAIGVASIRHWHGLARMAFGGAGLWSLIYIAAAVEPEAGPVALLVIVKLVVLATVWLRKPNSGDHAVRIPASATAAAFAGLVTAAFLHEMADAAVVRLLATTIFAMMIAIAVWRPRAMSLLHAAALSAMLIQLWDFADAALNLIFDGGSISFVGAWPVTLSATFAPYAAAIALLFLVAGFPMASRTVGRRPKQALAWAFWAAAVPLLTTTSLWISFGDLDIDWRFALPSLALVACLVASSDLVSRAERPAQHGGLAVSCLATGAAAASCLFLLAGFGPTLTTILTGMAAALPAVATRRRSWPVLGWLSVGFGAVTLTRIVADPTIAGADMLSATPVLNALTPGYFLPAAAFAFAAWQLPQMRARRIMEALACLFVLLGVAMLVRHAMNGGVIDAGEPALAEHAIYTLVMIGGGAILLELDLRAHSPVFRWGSMALGVMSLVSIAASHLVALNPLFTNASTGAIAVFNLLLLAYLLPAASLAALAWRARDRRPQWYVSMLGAGSCVLAFAYVILSVRRLFQGEFVGAWKGMDELETYAHSAVWLMLGVALLVIGLRLESRTLRLASAVLVLLAVAKVFLYDMRELEGVLRALSFMGLGGVLIGIGLFYQRTLATKANVSPR